MCLECAAQLREELDARARETEAECDAYRERLAELERETAAANFPRPATGPDGADLAEALARAEREEAEALAEAATLDAELDTLRAERLELESKSRELDAREAAYWDDFNDFKLALRAHVEERDGLVVNIEQTARQLERLRQNERLQRCLPHLVRRTFRHGQRIPARATPKRPRGVGRDKRRVGHGVSAAQHHGVRDETDVSSPHLTPARKFLQGV